ncbi:MAG TPA: cupin domain-containing protein [Actinomycetota bacterium]
MEDPAEPALEPTLVLPGDRLRPPEGQTSGMVREQAFAAEDRWVGYVSMDPGLVSGWHHHDGFTTFVYVATGLFRVEFGADGSKSLQSGPGAFVRIPPHAIHRETNPGNRANGCVVFRTGTGTAVVNVEGPAG